MRTKIINLTPHDIKIVREGKVVATIPASGNVARLTTSITIHSGFKFDGINIPLTKTNFSEVENLPEERDDTLLMVSQLIKNCPDLQDRNDLVVPAEMVRDENNNIIGCRSFGL